MASDLPTMDYRHSPSGQPAPYPAHTSNDIPHYNPSSNWSALATQTQPQPQQAPPPPPLQPFQTYREDRNSISFSTSSSNRASGSWQLDLSPFESRRASSIDVPSLGGHRASPLPPMSVAPTSTSFTPSRFEEKGKGVDRSSLPWVSDFEKLVEHAQTDREVEKNVDKLRADLGELISLMRPHAATGEASKSPSRPSAALHARFLHLSRSVHTSLIALGPHVALTLSPEFTKPPPATSQSSLSAAEKEMELIRQRRDVLIAKAAQLAAAASARAAAQITELPTPPEVRDLQLEAFRREMGMLNELAMPPDFDDYKNGALTGLQGGDALGRCHGCGIGVTGEWMRGPDGPRSLCDSCGSHYARLLEKRNTDEFTLPRNAFSWVAVPGTKDPTA
ncbi:hypothetical protein JCM24511_04681 [Saitozyma sp. JCM 24511]|nr:hypothetical protein JCM24511_04681 [Saitozyma sp. JCM 24511]